MSKLEDLFTKYGTDKGIWGYTPAYEKHLEPMITSARNILEIGICGFRDIPNNRVGASLYAWRDYFPNAMIHGIDNDGRFIFEDERIKTQQADAYNATQLAKSLIKFGVATGFDFICDDAVHDPVPQLYLLRSLWPLVKKGGVYAIEEFCPYKVPSEEVFAHLALELAPLARLDVYTTHKEERLAVFTKVQ